MSEEVNNNLANAFLTMNGHAQSGLGVSKLIQTTPLDELTEEKWAYIQGNLASIEVCLIYVTEACKAAVGFIDEPEQMKVAYEQLETLKEQPKDTEEGHEDD